MTKLWDISLPDLKSQAQAITRQYFGRAISLYAPLYLANYCENKCTYCGYHAGLDIPRVKLTLEEIDQECHSLAATGIQNILLLTGESKKHSPVSYIKDAVLIAKKYFSSISLEVYPLELAEYQELYAAGADGVTVYQETYDRERYAELHPAGKKRDYDWRYQTPERIAQAGYTYLSMGVLLGLADWRQDVLRLFEHVRYLEKKFPGIEYGLSFPRLRKINEDKYFLVSDEDLLRIICTARILFPRLGINLSTRESAEMRDQLLPYGITRVSAGSLTTVGGYSQAKAEVPQFKINDDRSVSEMKAMLTAAGFDPVFTDGRLR